MSKITDVQWNFSAGQVAPRFLGRADVAKYDSALALCRNFLPLRLGGITRRPGTAFVARARYADTLTRVIRFQYSTEQAYAIELGDEYMRFYRDNAQLLDTFPIATADVGANEFRLVGDQTDHLGVGDAFDIDGSTGNDGSYTIAAITYDGGTSRTIITPSPAVADDTDDGDLIAPTTIATPWPASALREVKFTQSADIMYFGHSDFAPRELRRTAGSDSDGDTWSLIEHPRQDGPYLLANTTATTLTPSATTGTATITASSTTGINDGQGFLASDVGRLIRLSNPASGENWGWATITARTSSTVVDVTISRGFATTNATDIWRLGAWSDTTGWPQVPMFHGGGLWWGATTSAPQTVWRSRINAFTVYRDENFAGETLDDLGLAWTIDSDQVNAIRALASDLRGLLIFTSGGEFVLSPRGAFDPLTPTNVEALLQSAIGAHPTANVLNVGPAALYVQRAGRRLHEFAFRFEDDRFRSPDLTLLAEDIGWSGFVELCFQQNPENIVWLAQSNGQLAAMTYQREQDVVAWSIHVLGGAFGSGIAHVESVCTIQRETTDQVWLATKRTIDGATARYIERLTDAFETAPGVTREDAFFVDCGLTYDGAPATTITGLTHLIGETVDCWADGEPVIGLTVDEDGEITLPEAASIVHVGLPYESRARSMPIVGDEKITAWRKRVVKVHLRLFESMGTLQYGGQGVDDPATLDEIDLNGETALHDINDLATGVLTQETAVHLATFPQYTVAVNTPGPMTITQITFNVEVGGD